MKNKNREMEKRVSDRKNSLCSLKGKKVRMTLQVMKLVQNGWNKSICYKGEKKTYSRNW